MKSKRNQMGLLLAVLAIAIASCSGPSRSASTPVDVPGQPPVDQTQQPQDQPTDVASEVETLMAGDLATQTAVASGEQPVDPQPTTEDQAPEPSATPIPDNNSPGDPTAVPPTATEVPPTNTPQPQADCTSPYTVKKGDWVWDIGRRCNIHPNSIIAANNLYYPYLIYAGDVLVLPANAPPFPGP